jgi:glucose dehydrogenase
MGDNRVGLVIGLLGGAFGLATGVLAIALGVTFAITGWSLLGVAGAYYAIAGVAGGLFLLVVGSLVRKKRGASA